jgi:hypothetical protein
MGDFHQISIRGRYVYCYLCLKNTINNKSLEDIPEFLDVILRTFTMSSRLDDWQGEVDEVMTSIILDVQNAESYYKLISNQQVLELRKYYLKNMLVADMIENLIWLGISNLYGGFNSSNTFQYVKKTMNLMNDNRIELPDFSVISSCSVNDRGGWGNPVSMDFFSTR